MFRVGKLVYFFVGVLIVFALLSPNISFSQVERQLEDPDFSDSGPENDPPDISEYPEPFRGMDPEVVSDEWLSDFDGQGLFGNPRFIGNFNQIRTIFSDDFNQDGMEDLGVVTIEFNSRVLIFLGIGNGDFEFANEFVFGRNDFGITTGDYNNDSIPDIAIQDTFTPGIKVFLGEGNGAFNPVFQIILSVEQRPFSLVSSDFNLDGFLDIGAALHDSERFQVFLGNGLGAFAPMNVIRTFSAISSIDVGDFNSDEIPDLVVVSQKSHETKPGNMSIYLGIGNGKFLPRIEIKGNTSILGFKTGDFSEDHFDDVVFLGRQQSSPFGFLVSFFLGTGETEFLDRGFQVVPHFSQFFGFDFADFNLDGIQDIFYHISHRGFDAQGIPVPGSVSVQAGTGNGAFFPPIEFTIGIFPAFSLSRDWNNDGKPDLVVGGIFGDIFSLINLGQLDSDGDGRPDNVDVCNFITEANQNDSDGDGWGDSCDNCPSVFNLIQLDSDLDGMGNECDPCSDLDGDGFGTPTTLASICPPDNCAATVNPAQGDWDQDGKGDLCDFCTDPDGDRLGTPGFAGNLCRDDNCPDVSNPDQVDDDFDGIGNLCDTCFDSDHDGFGDPGFPDNECTVDICPDDHDPLQLESDGDGFGDACDTCPFQYDPGQEDRDQDGSGDLCDSCPDLANSKNATFAQINPISLEGVSRGLATGDFNNDGNEDFAVRGFSLEPGGPRGVYLRMGRGDGTFLPPDFLPYELFGEQVLVHDFDLDGNLDMIIESDGQRESSLFKGDGAGGFLISRVLSFPIRNAEVGDFNEDGFPDIITAGGGLWQGSPFGFFRDIGLFFFISNHSLTDVAVGDFDKDGHLDAAFSISNRAIGIFKQGFLSFAFGEGDGTFHFFEEDDPPLMDAWLDSFALEVADVNLDGWDDVVLVNFNGNVINPPLFGKLSVFLNNRTGDRWTPFHEQQLYDLGKRPRRILVEDFSNDGIPDVAVSNFGSQDISLLFGIGDGRFEEAISLPLSDSPLFLESGDFNNDGRIDILTSKLSESNVSLHLNFDQSDRDGDGFGDRCDNCPALLNPSQTNFDGDFMGDECDFCPMDGLNDVDEDFLCADQDVCSFDFNPGQEDFEGDGVGDICDNCSSIANFPQQDLNQDGVGDFCQPIVSINNVSSDGLDRLVVETVLLHPLGESLTGQVEVESASPPTILGNFFQTFDCADVYSFQMRNNHAIGYAKGNEFVLLIDFSEFCPLPLPVSSIGLSRGACEENSGSFGFSLDLFGLILPLDFCVREGGGFSTPPTFRQFRLLEFNENFARILDSAPRTLDEGVFSGIVIPQLDISQLSPGQEATVRITATDGQSIPVSDEYVFSADGESVLIFQVDQVPFAVAAGPSPVECEDPGGTAVVMDGSGSIDPDSSAGTNDDISAFEWYEDFGFPGETLLGTGAVLNQPLVLGEHRITLVVRDSEGAFSTDELAISVIDTAGPVLTLPPDTIKECTGPDGAQVDFGFASATDACFGSVPINVNAVPGIFPIGTTFITWSAVDPAGNPTADSQAIQVVDSTPPSIQLTTPVSTLWPPNHRMIDLETVVSAQDVCGGSLLVLDRVTSDEPDDAAGSGDGKTVNDIQGVSEGILDTAFQLRAERSGTGDGRTYSITYLAVDDRGNQNISTVEVRVPHNVGGMTDPVALNTLETEIGGRVDWLPVPGASHYNVVRGLVSKIKDEGDYYHLGKLDCVASGITDPTTAGMEDPELPPIGDAFFYLVEYFDGMSSGYGTESAAKPRFVPPGQGTCP